MVSTVYNIGILWLPIEYLLIAPLASTDYIFMSSDYHFDIYWLHMWCLVTITVVLLAMVLSVFLTTDDPLVTYYNSPFWFHFWWLLITTLIYYYCQFSILWFPILYLLIASLMSSDFPLVSTDYIFACHFCTCDHYIFCLFLLTADDTFVSLITTLLSSDYPPTFGIILLNVLTSK